MAEDTNTTTGTNGDSSELSRIDDTQEMMTPVVDAGAVPQAPRPASEVPPPAQASAPTFSATPKPTAPIDLHENETEYERSQRLKLNSDAAPHSGAISDDIAKILKDVRLPERRNFTAAADPKKPAESAPPAPPPTPAGTIPAAPAMPANDGPPKRDIVTALHTLKDDLQDIVLVHKMSQVRATALEQDKMRGQPDVIDESQTPAARQRSKRTITLVFVSLLFIGFGVAALLAVVYIVQNQTTSVAKQYPSIIFAEQSKVLAIDGTRPSALKAAIASARNGTGSPIGSITRIIPATSTTTPSGSAAIIANLQQFLSALGVRPPDQLMRGLGSDFFFGIHTVDINGPVFIIPVTSYDLAFSGMLAWEPNMNSDLAPIFDLAPALVTGPDGLPTQRTFSDAVILNYDVRELKDDTGAVVLYYSFPTPNILIIAESVHSFPEILSRLQAQRLL